MMKIKALILATITLITFSPAMAQEENLTELTISMIKIPDGKGDVHIAVYRPEDDWLKFPAFKEMDIPGSEISEDRTLTTTMKLVPGSYALSIYFDENGNGKLDTKLFGIPKEPTGMSNNHRPRFGPPRFKRAQFEIGADPVTQEIELK